MSFQKGDRVIWRLIPLEAFGYSAPIPATVCGRRGGRVEISFPSLRNGRDVRRLVPGEELDAMPIEAQPVDGGGPDRV